MSGGCFFLSCLCLLWLENEGHCLFYFTDAQDVPNLKNDAGCAKAKQCKARENLFLVAVLFENITGPKFDYYGSKTCTDTVGK